MKLNQIKSIGLSPKTIDELEFDPVAAVVSDEFNRRSLTSGTSYRQRAVLRLRLSGLPLRSETNICHELVTQFVHIDCPYCLVQMYPNGGGGSGGRNTVEFICTECSAKASITLGERDLSFSK